MRQRVVRSGMVPLHTGTFGGQYLRDPPATPPLVADAPYQVLTVSAHRQRRTTRGPLRRSSLLLGPTATRHKGTVHNG